MLFKISVEIHNHQKIILYNYLNQPIPILYSPVNQVIPIRFHSSITTQIESINEIDYIQ